MPINKSKELLSSLLKELGISEDGALASKAQLNDVTFIGEVNKVTFAAVLHIDPLRVAKILKTYAKLYSEAMEQAYENFDKHSKN